MVGAVGGDEDAKLVTLARAAVTRARGAAEGAAVRDEAGRTYAATAVEVGPLRLSALEVATAMAVSSGVQRLEAAALVADGAGERPTHREVELLALLGDPAITVHPTGRES